MREARKWGRHRGAKAWATATGEAGHGAGVAPQGPLDGDVCTRTPSRRLKAPPTRALPEWLMAAVARDFPRLTAPLQESFWEGVPSGTLAEGAASSLSVDDIRPYIEAGVLHEVEDIESAGRFREVCNAWVVPSGTALRLIVHPAALNDAVRPPTFGMPSPRDVAHALAGATSTLTFDYRSHYYQIPLPRHLAETFLLRTRDGRLWALSRPPMGASVSAAIAESVTRWIAGVGEDESWGGRRRVLTYIDNTLVVDPDVEAWERRVGVVELSEWQTTKGGERGKFIGLEYYLGPPTWTRPTGSLIEKWRAAVVAARRGRDSTAGRELAGLTVAIIERGMWPLSLAADLIRPNVGPLDAGEEADVAAIEQRLEGGGWTRSHFPERGVRAATDASGRGWGVVMCVGGATRTWAGVFRHPEAHINLKELSAVERAAEFAPADVELQVDVDSAVVVEWVNGGYARSRWAREMILRIDAKLAAKGSTVRAQWVESGVNAADCLSRGLLFAGWEPTSWNPPPQRRVLGGAVPVTPREVAEIVKLF